MNKTYPEPGPVAHGQAFRAMPIGIASVSNRIFTDVNDRLCALLGYRPDELIGQPTRILFSDDGEFQRVGREFYSDLDVHGAGAIETIFLSKDAQPINVLLTSTRIERRDETVAVTFNVVDVTEARRMERELFWQNRELTALHRVSEIMLSGQPDQNMFDAIARETAEMTAFPVVSIELCDFDRAVMIYRGAHGISLAGMPAPFEVPMDVTLSGEVAYSGQTLVETETLSRREYAAPILRQLGVQTYVCLPIKTGNKVIGTLSLAHRDKVEIEPRVIVAATSLANYLAMLLDRLQTRGALRQGEAELAAVYDRAPSAMCLFDERLNIVRANQAAADLV